MIHYKTFIPGLTPNITPGLAVGKLVSLLAARPVRKITSDMTAQKNHSSFADPLRPVVKIKSHLPARADFKHTP